MAKTDKPNFEALTTKEIAVLYKKTLAEAQKQRGNEQAQNQAREDLGFDLVYHKDAFGNMVEGPAPKAKPTRNYVDASGYVQELGPGEVAPVAPGATLARACCALCK